MEESRINKQKMSVGHVEEEIITPLSGFFRYYKVRALETNLLCIMDVEALNKLAALNQLQQQAALMKESSAEYKDFRKQFSLLYNWLHEINHYYIYRDTQTGLWRLGFFLRRKNGC